MNGARLFVIGSGRSGTSLMWRTVNLDPDVAVTPETHFLDKWLGDRNDLAAVWDDFRSSGHFARLGLAADVRPPTGSAREMYAWFLDRYAEARGAAVSGEKTPAYFRHLPTLLDWFPEATVLFVVRDPRAVVASLAAHDEAWAEGSILQHARLWRAAARTALEWQHDPRLHVVRYEEFVADPVAVLDRVWPSLTGHRFDPAWLAANAEDPDRRLASGSLVGPSQITGERLEVWRQRLAPADAALVLSACREEMEQLGYSTEDRPAGRISLLRAAVREDAFRARRALRHPAGFVARTRARMARRRGARR